MNTRAIAQICHEANRTYCAVTADAPQPAWENAPLWQIESSISGVEFRLANPGAPPSAQHEQWMAEKLALGWKLGPVKNNVTLEHPCLVPYVELPPQQKAKDALFIAIVESLRSFVTAD